MRYLKYLNEGFGGEYYYHYTNRLIDILKSDQLNLSSTLGTSGDRLTKKFFFLSLTRTPNREIGYGRHSRFRIVFDAKKLKSRYKIIPVDYWQNKNPADYPAFKNMQVGKQTLKDLNSEMNMRNEYEERLVSDRSYIKGIFKYIDHIDMILEKNNNSIKKIIELCKQNNIKYFVYANDKDMLMSRNAITSDIEVGEDEPYEIDNTNWRNGDRFGDYEYFLAILLYDEKYIQDYDLLDEDLKAFLKKHNMENIGVRSGTSTYSVHDRMRSVYYGNRDVVPAIEAELHNYFKGGYSGKFRDIVHLLVSQMKKLQVKTISELLDIKVRGRRPKDFPKKDWSAIYQLSKYHKEYWADEEPGTYEPIPNDTLFKDLRHFYYMSFGYGGQFDKDEFEIIYQIDKGDKPVSNFINYIFNRFTEEVAIKKIEATGWDEHSKRDEYKVVKIK